MEFTLSEGFASAAGPLFGALRLGGLEAWRLEGLEAWRLGGLEAWMLGGLEASWVGLGTRWDPLARSLGALGSFLESLGIV